MEIVNGTKILTGYTQGLKPDGREMLVVVAKGTFNIPVDGSTPRLLDKQLEFVDADQFTGEPGYSAPLYETDYAPFKPRCDVLLNGSAYAPGGKPVKKLEVGLKVGRVNKSFRVVGNRQWRGGLGLFTATGAEPFTQMPISYDNAFGGTDDSHNNGKKHRTYLTNHVGVGFHVNFSESAIKGAPLPNTEELDYPVTSPDGNYAPQAFGPVGRAWKPRYQYAGTYDDKWLEETYPFLPPDFNEAYFQAAPLDQQTDYLRGGEEVVLRNLSPQGIVRFTIPTIPMPIEFTRNDYSRTQDVMNCDTLLIEPDLERFTLSWRASLPLKRDMFEVTQVVIGEMTRAWYRARELGKTYYRSIDLLAKEKAEL
jgi:hypothetical protein